jgi:PAS domain S-box-containing protein
MGALASVAALAYPLAFALLLLTTVLSARAAWRYRDARRLDILLAMVTLAIAPAVRGPHVVVLRAAGTALTLAVPYLLLRLVQHFRDVPVALRVGAMAVALMAFPAALIWPHADPTTVTSVLSAYLGVLLAYVALAFLTEAKRTAGVTAMRLVFASVGTWMFAAVFLVAGMAFWFRFLREMGSVQQIVDAAAFSCYFVAFSPPRSLRTRWQHAEQARYLSETAGRDAEERGEHAAGDLMRAAVRSVGHSLALVALRHPLGTADLVVQAASDPAWVGTDVACGTGLVGRVCRTGVEAAAPVAACEPELAERVARLGVHVLVAPIASVTQSWGVVIVVQRRGALFPDDDQRLLSNLARYAATALDHAHLVIESRERERRAAARRLHEVEARMELMLDSIKDYAMFILDDEGRIATWQPGAEQVFGYTTAEIADESAAPLYNMTAQDFQTLLAGARRLGHADWEGTCRRRDGERFIGATTIRPLEKLAGEPPGFVAVTRDVTSQRDLEGRLRQSQKLEAVGQLAAGVAHDFNNLLTAILGYADWLAQDLAGDAAKLGHVAEIQKAAERAAALTRQLLAFGRRQLIEPAPVDAARLVDDLLPMLRRLIGEQVEIIHETDPRLPAVLGDRSQIEQVIVNLAVNARDAMPTGGRLTIRTTETWVDGAIAGAELVAGPHLQIEVIDTGIGMSEDLQAHIFEPFFTTKEVGRGTGLGLSTVYGVVGQMGGVVRVQSERGHGATFRILLPAAHGQPAPVEAPRLEAAPPPRGRETLLLVEDEEAVRHFLTRALERAGYRVLSAADPPAAVALAMATDDAIDLLVTDVVLPGGTGPELAKVLTATRPALPVLYISGYADAVLARQQVRPKVSHFLQKPFSAAELVARVRHILAQP